VAYQAQLAVSFLRGVRTYRASPRMEVASAASRALNHSCRLWVLLDREAVRPGVPMKVTRLSIIAALLAATVTGCIVHTAPCYHDCGWSHGHRVCARRCY
jgi:hypothetical protein